MEKKDMLMALKRPDNKDMSQMYRGNIFAYFVG